MRLNSLGQSEEVIEAAPRLRFYQITLLWTETTCTGVPWVVNSRVPEISIMTLDKDNVFTRYQTPIVVAQVYHLHQEEWAGS